MREADTACFEAAAAADAAPGDRKLRTKHARAEAWLAEANSEAVAALQLAEPVLCGGKPRFVRTCGKPHVSSLTGNRRMCRKTGAILLP